MSYSEHNRWPEGTPQHVKVLQAQEVEINFLRQTILLQHDTNRRLLGTRDALRAALIEISTTAPMTQTHQIAHAALAKVQP